MTPGIISPIGGSPSASRMNGTVQPPMHASTWQRTSRSAAAAAIGSMGSTIPWAYEGAETTTRAVRSSIAATIASTSAANVTGSIGTDTSSTSNRWQALTKAGCTEDGATSVGWPCGCPTFARHRSRAPRTARAHDSVPPLVIVPTSSGLPLPSTLRAAATRSFSTAAKLGKAVGSKPLTCSDRANARSPRSSRSSRSGSYTYEVVRPPLTGTSSSRSAASVARITSSGRP